MNRPDISIIVPIYNAEKYLEECLNSIHNQTFSNYEVLMINDGSSDHSEKICKAFHEKDDRFTLINQSNSGVCRARNVGIQISKGNYISFVDSDDKIDPDFLESMYKVIIDSDSDIVMCDFYNENGAESNNQIIHVIEGTEIYEAYLKYVIYNRVMNKLYRRDCISSIPFPEDRPILEDAFWTAKVLESVHKITILPEAKYYYRIVAGSLSHKKLDENEKSAMYRNKLERFLVITKNYSHPDDKRYLVDEVLHYFDIVIIASNNLINMGVFDCMNQIMNSSVMTDSKDERVTLFKMIKDPDKLHNKYLKYIILNRDYSIKYKMFSIYRLLIRRLRLY